MNLSDNQKRALSLLALGADSAPRDPKQRAPWARLMGKLCALGYAERTYDTDSTASYLDEAYRLTEAGRVALNLRVREAAVLAGHWDGRARDSADPAERQRCEQARQLWRDELLLLGGAPPAAPAKPQESR
jgi:hypothetical protein